jgi:hypothetical protein
MIACVDVSAAGTIVGVAGADATTSGFFPEGCQCMQGGVGPGPWSAVNNYVEGSGNMWHHDDSGGSWMNPGDYTYYRNTFTNPLWTMWGNNTSNPASDWNRYLTRQVNEWKGGQRIQLYGNIYSGSYNDVSPSALTIAFSNVDATGLADIDFQYNTVQHVAGGMLIGSYPNSPPTYRYRFANNLFWDLNGNSYHTICVQGNCSFSGQGWLFEGPEETEDLIVDHNTTVGNVGSVPVMFGLAAGYSEGVQVTNNLFYIAPGYQGVQRDGTGTYDGCPSVVGKGLMDCMFRPSYVFNNNVLIGNGATQGDIQGWYSGLTNIVPTNMSLSSLGWFNCPGPLCTSGSPDFHLKANYCSGCGSAATDLSDVGANVDKLLAAQGNVLLRGVPAASITSSTATVAFIAPDSAGCSVDYSSTDGSLLNNYTRVSDPGGNRVRSVTLTGLSSGTTYHYRVNCAVQQPTGEFRTN